MCISILSQIHPEIYRNFSTPYGTGKDHEKQFRQLIDIIIQNSSLHLPDPTKELFVQTDASQNCGDRCVFQKR
jgi:hypothetical protein